MSPARRNTGHGRIDAADRAEAVIDAIRPAALAMIELCHRQPEDAVRRSAGYANSAVTASSNAAVCRSTSSAVVAGDIRAMLWNGVNSTPRFIAERCR